MKTQYIVRVDGAYHNAYPTYTQAHDELERLRLFPRYKNARITIDVDNY